MLAATDAAAPGQVRLQGSLAALGAPYTTVAAATPLPMPRRLIDNPALAAELALPGARWCGAEATAMLAGNQAWPGYAPRATIYAGHQFGRYTRQLGDGRALLIAELDGPAGAIELQTHHALPESPRRVPGLQSQLAASVGKAGELAG